MSALGRSKEAMKKKRLIYIAAVLVIVTILSTLLVSCGSMAKIRITNGDVKYSESQGKYVVVYFDDNGKASYRIEYEVSPKRMKNKAKIEYKETEGVSVSDDGLVTFTSAIYNEETVHSIRVSVTLENKKSSTRDEILIIAKYKT